MKKINKLDFVNDIKALFEEIDTTNFNISTNFKENEEWDSMCALSLIAVLDDKYNTQISGNQISEMKTINDLINYIENA